MFANLGLFSRIPCPDIVKCTRRSCLFSHDPSITSEVVEGDVTATPTSYTRQPVVNRKVASRPTASIAISHPTVFAKTPAPPSASSSTFANRPAPPLRQLTIKAPVLNINSRLSRQPVLDRRKGLERLYDEYRALYATILRTDPSCAADHALIEESSISNGTTVASYGSAIRSACMQLRARGEMPKDPSSRFYGTIAEVKVKMKRWEEDQRSRLTKENVRGYLMTPEQMEVFGYVYSTPEGEGSTHTTCLGERKMCDRCGVDFTVRGPAEQATAPHPPCVYHWGKATMERIDGHRMARWSCCGSDRTLNEHGCAIAEFHVFKDGKSWKFSDRRQMATDEDGQKREKKEEIEVLHSREAFKSTKRVLRELREASGTAGTGNKRKRDGVHEIVAMDCEMIYTSSGMSLARVSVLNAQGESILDEFVKQTGTILDVNEKFSGLTMEDMRKATKDLPEVRRDMCRLIDEDTIIIGHGLENDLKSLRLVHRRVIDSAVLFPHPKGAPFRRALKDLTSEKLGLFIQNNILEEGHDSGADARAALDLVKWKFRKDTAAPGDFSYA